MDSQIPLAIPILGQQVLNLNSSMLDILTNGFNKQLEHTSKLEGKLDDFLEGKVAFTFTPVKMQKLLNTSAATDSAIPIDPRLQRSSRI